MFDSLTAHLGDGAARGGRLTCNEKIRRNRFPHPPHATVCNGMTEDSQKVCPVGCARSNRACGTKIQVNGTVTGTTPNRADGGSSPPTCAIIPKYTLTFGERRFIMLS